MADIPFADYEFKAGVLGTPPSDTRADRDLPTRLQDVLNAKDYGCVGDGVTDDTAAIQAFFKAAWEVIGSVSGGPLGSGNRGRILYFPRGVYRVSHTIEIDYDHALGLHGIIEIEGAGRDVTTIVGNVPGLPILWTGVLATHIEVCPTPTDEAPFISDSPFASSSSILLRDFTVKNESTAALSRAFWATNVGSAVGYKNMKFIGVWGWGFHTNCFHPYFHDCIAECIGHRIAGSVGFHASAGDWENCRASGFETGFAINSVGGRMMGCRASDCTVGFAVGTVTLIYTNSGCGAIALRSNVTDDCATGFDLLGGDIAFAGNITRNSTSYGINFNIGGMSFIYAHTSVGDAVPIKLGAFADTAQNMLAAVPTSSISFPSPDTGATANYIFLDQSKAPFLTYNSIIGATNFIGQAWEPWTMNIVDGSPGSAIFGATITGGGSGRYKIRYDGFNWIRVG